MISDWFDIDEQHFNVHVMSIKEKGSILYSDNTGRTMAPGAPMSLDPLGTFHNYSIVVKRNGDYLDDYDRLKDYVLKPRYNGFKVKVPFNQSTITFDAYASATERETKHIDENGNKIKWNEMTIDIISMKAQVLPG